MKFQKLTDAQINDLKWLHRYEKDGRVRDRIKAVLLKNEGKIKRLLNRYLFIKKQ